MGIASLDEMRERILSITSKHADYADLYLQSGTSHSARFEDGRMDQLASGMSDGCGARVVRGDTTFFSRGSGASSPIALLALSNALSAAGNEALSRSLKSGRNDLLIQPVGEIPPLETDFMKNTDSQIRKKSKYIRQITLSYRTSLRDILIVKGDGSVVTDKRCYSNFAVNIVVEKKGVLQTGYEAISVAGSVYDLWKHRTAEEVAEEALRRAHLMLEATPCPAGSMPVILDGDAGGTMVHEACGHGLEADIVLKDFSVYADKIGELVASPMITLVDDATIPGAYGSYQYDDEGNSPQRTLLIENGILKSYLSDIQMSLIGGFPITGNGRRESSQYAPLPRMSNTFVLPGKTETGEMLETIKQGLYVKKMGGGEVDTTSGDYVFYVSEGYLIENGKVGKTVRGATLTGNGPKTLLNIAAVGKHYTLEAGVCGKSGQGVPVTDGQPTLLLKDIIVGGSDTDYGTSNT